MPPLPTSSWNWGRVERHFSCRRVATLLLIHTYPLWELDKHEESMLTPFAPCTSSGLLWWAHQRGISSSINVIDLKRACGAHSVNRGFVHKKRRRGCSMKEGVGVEDSSWSGLWLCCHGIFISITCRGQMRVCCSCCADRTA